MAACARREFSVKARDAADIGSALNAPDIQGMRKTAEILCSLPAAFGATLAAHMKRLNITSEALAEDLNVSPRKISTLRNSIEPAIGIPALTAICIGLHLEPDLSEDLIYKAGRRFLPLEEHMICHYLIRMKYQSSVEECNAIMIAAGCAPLLGKRGQDEKN